MDELTGEILTIKQPERPVAPEEKNTGGEKDDLETRAITDRLSTVEHTGLALSALVHERVRFSPYGEIMANFIRFRGKVGERLFLGTNHEGSSQELRLVDSYAQDILNRGIKTAYVEQGGSSAQDDLDKWLQENEYTAGSTETGKTNELAYLSQNLRGRGVQVVNMDLAHNPSALSFAIQRFGVERTAKAINWDLSIKTKSLDLNNPGLDRSKIPEIVTRLINEAGGEATHDQVAQIIQGRDMTDGDYFTDSEREEYMASLIKDQKVAVAAHTAHTTVLLDRTSGNRQIENLEIYVDSDKVDRVIAETKKTKNPPPAGTTN